jgi:hypothetical protein
MICSLMEVITGQSDSLSKRKGVNEKAHGGMNRKQGVRSLVRDKKMVQSMKNSCVKKTTRVKKHN